MSEVPVQLVVWLAICRVAMVFRMQRFCPRGIVVYVSFLDL